MGSPLCKWNEIRQDLINQGFLDEIPEKEIIRSIMRNTLIVNHKKALQTLQALLFINFIERIAPEMYKFSEKYGVEK